jgi:carbamoyl-phosphate synthase large subunit
VLGWKEFEMEVVRDAQDNCIIVCSIENVDPMGIHTGDSITVAPALTLTDKEYQIMRNASIACLREIGVDTGGSNVQFAVNPADGRLVVIEMNPRVSRSSALASKATGFPIAKVAAPSSPSATRSTSSRTTSPASRRQASSRRSTTSSPRCRASPSRSSRAREALLTTSMKSVGEAMSIGRTFAESVQKALRSMETGSDRIQRDRDRGRRRADRNKEAIRAALLAKPTPDRLLVIAQALRHGLSVDECTPPARSTRGSSRASRRSSRRGAAARQGLPTTRRAGASSRDGLLRSRASPSSRQDATARSAPPRALGIVAGLQAHRHLRRRVRLAHALHVLDLRGRRRRRPECEADPTDRRKIVILGGGPNRIGQGIEFDYCCVHAVYACARPATRRSWSTATRRPCRPTTTPRTGSTSSR